jgi:hypothetical protein
MQEADKRKNLEVNTSSETVNSIAKCEANEQVI